MDYEFTEAMEVTQCDGIGNMTESIISFLTLKNNNSVVRVARSSVYRLDITLRELTTAQAYVLTMFDALLAEDVHTCSLLLGLASSVVQLRSPYMEVWLREDFNFEKEDVIKVLVALDRMGLNVPGHILRIFAGLTEKYGSSMKVVEVISDPLKTIGLVKDELFLEPLPPLEIPSQELVITKRCLGLPPNTNSVDVKVLACKTDIEGYALLHRLAEAGHTQAVEELLSAGVPVNLPGPGGSLAIHYAAEYGQSQVMPILQKNGCNISAPRKDGNTPIHLAASMGKVETVGWLIKNGAEINAKNCKGQTPLHVAAAGGHAAVLSALLDYLSEQRKQEGIRLGAISKGMWTADPRDEEGCTPLHLAARANNMEAVKILLERGADIYCLNSEGLTPIKEATMWGALEVERYLLDVRAGRKGKLS